MCQQGLMSWVMVVLTHLPLVLHICINESMDIGSDNGLPSIQRQAII